MTFLSPSPCAVFICQTSSQLKQELLCMIQVIQKKYSFSTIITPEEKKKKKNLAKFLWNCGHFQDKHNTVSGSTD